MDIEKLTPVELFRFQIKCVNAINSVTPNLIVEERNKNCIRWRVEGIFHMHTFKDEEDIEVFINKYRKTIEKTIFWNKARITSFATDMASIIKNRTPVFNNFRCDWGEKYADFYWTVYTGKKKNDMHARVSLYSPNYFMGTFKSKYNIYWDVYKVEFQKRVYGIARFSEK